MQRVLIVTLFAALLGGADAAEAHPFGVHELGFVQGFGHPFGGIDHLLAMIAVGVWAAQLGGRARWIVPASFVVTMAAGALAGLLQLPLPHVELAIGVSLLALGTLVAGAVRAPMAAGAVVVAVVRGVSWPRARHRASRGRLGGALRRRLRHRDRPPAPRWSQSWIPGARAPWLSPAPSRRRFRGGVRHRAHRLARAACELTSRSEVEAVAQLEPEIRNGQFRCAAISSSPARTHQSEHSARSPAAHGAAINESAGGPRRSCRDRRRCRPG